jgi:hypothetical protein
MSTEPQIQKITAAQRMAAARAAKAAKAAQRAQTPIDDGVAVQAAPARPSPRSTAPRQTAQREPTREPTRKGQVLGRNGEVLSRKRTSVGDIFHIPKELIPDGWSYQWAAVSVVGNTEILLDQNLMMAENGWRPVPASRYPGRFMPEGTGDKPIVRGGQMLMERPKALSDEARAEDIRNAKQLISDRNDALKLSGVKQAMPDGFEMNQRYRGTGGNIKMSIDRGLDIPSPAHTLAEPGE